MDTTSPTARESRPSQARILVIDDHEVTREVLADSLAAEGYDVVQAGDGPSGIDEALTRTPDLVLCDVTMPGMDGFEVCRRMRGDARLADVPFILLTALDDRRSKLTGLEAGADDFVSKPFDRAELLTRVRTIVRLNRFRRLHDEKARFERLLETSPFGIAMVEADGTIVLANRVFRDLVRAPDGTSIVGTILDERIEPSLRQAHRVCWQQALQGAGVVRSETELWAVDGERVPVAMTTESFEWDGRISMQCIIEPIGERLAYQRQLERMLNFDQLTGLPNRNLVTQRLALSLERSGASDGCVGVVFVDVDRLATINEGAGHAVGDAVLRQVADRLAQVVRPGDTLGRFSGGKMVIVLDGLEDADEATARAYDVHQRAAGTYDVAGREVAVSLSVGIAVSPGDGRDGPGLLRNAEIAMRRAKSRGGGSVAAFSSTMESTARRTLELETELKRAIDRRELFLVYQPKVFLSNTRLHGFEALIRWKRDGAMVSPAEFIPLAEHTGLILPIGAWVIDEACRQIAAWKARFGIEFPVAVNVSARQFAAQNVVELCAQSVEAHGISPHCLQLELTESAVMEDPVRVIDTLNELRARGHAVFLDDFVTGYSSLAYLRRFALDALKIDRSFVMNVTSDAGSATLARAVIGLAHGLGLKVVAEGIETQEQAATLAVMGCDEAQGFYFYRPMPAADVDRLVEAGTLVIDTPRDSSYITEVPPPPSATISVTIPRSHAPKGLLGAEGGGSGRSGPRQS